MYFEPINKLKLSDLIETKKPIYAHVVNERKETLQEHMDLSVKYFERIISSKKLDNVFMNFENIFIKHLSNEGKLLFKEIIYNTVYMHDLGKINCNFQYKKMKNNEFRHSKGLRFNYFNHSILSSIIYINYYLNKIKQHADKNDKDILRVFTLLNAYIISKHHGALDTFYQFKEKLLELDGEGYRLYTEIMEVFNEVYIQRLLFNEDNNYLGKVFSFVIKQIEEYEKKQSEVSFFFYVYERFLSSVLLSCDYYATYEFMNQEEINNLGQVDNINKFYQPFKDSEIYKKIREYEKDNYGRKLNFTEVKNINILRTELFLDAEKALLNHLDKNIFYLEAPTGSGKSNTSMNLSFKIIEESQHINKMFYVYPFNTLVEQNIKNLNKIFENKDVIHDIAVINSVVPIKVKEKVFIDDKNENSDVINYNEALLDRQFLYYPLVVTTHVSLFNYLFGTSKDDLFPLVQMANSIIILDEIQSYKNSIWKEIITFLKYYSEALNIKVIIMSATLPDLNKLLNTKIETVQLIKDREKYFSHPLFKNRVELDFSILEYKEDIENILFQHLTQMAQETDKNILIEFIKKSTAQRFYERLIEAKEDETLHNKQIELITGDDNAIDRNKILSKISKEKNIILVATQVIEAGVDIDMDIGYKNISMLDLDEQFLGRINRSSKKEDGGKVYFFNLDEASSVYRNDVRKEKEISLRCESIREIILNKNFEKFYEYVLRILNKESNKQNDKNFDNFINENINKLDFIEIEKRMRLIDEQYEYTVFLNRKVILENGEELDGDKVWDKYVAVLKNQKLNYAEKKVLLSNVVSQLNYFTYKVKKNDFSYSKRIGDIYYIENGEDYFKNGKFSRKVFDEQLFF